MSTTLDRIGDVIGPVVAELHLDIYDIDYSGGVVKVMLDRPGGIDLEAITQASRLISAALDESDLIQAAYTLEVSSPGIERNLRTEKHFRDAIGERVKVKARPHPERGRRVEGTLTAADADGIVIQQDDGSEVAIPVAELESSRTVFVDSTSPKPGSARGSGSPKNKRPTNQSEATS